MRVQILLQRLWVTSELGTPLLHLPSHIWIFKFLPPRLITNFLLLQFLLRRVYFLLHFLQMGSLVIQFLLFSNGLYWIVFRFAFWVFPVLVEDKGFPSTIVGPGVLCSSRVIVKVNYAHVSNHRECPKQTVSTCSIDLECSIVGWLDPNELV